MKTRLAVVLLTVGGAAALTGCNDANKGLQAKTVGWFLDHRYELAMALKACRDNPGELAKTPNCVKRQ